MARTPRSVAGHSLLALALYRSLRRAAAHLVVASDARGLALEDEIAKIPEAFPQAPWRSSAADFPSALDFAHRTVRVRFDAVRRWDPTGGDAQTELMRGFAALRQCERRLAQLADPSWLGRDAAVQLCVGDVVRHRRFNYRAVVFGWDRTCDGKKRAMTEKMKRSLSGGLDQPFYQLLVDHADAQRVAGDGVDSRLHFSSAESTKRPMLSTYVPQENLVLDNVVGEFERASAAGESAAATGVGGARDDAAASYNFLDGRVAHPEIETFFSLVVPPVPGGARRGAKYVANERLRECYPEDT